MSGTGLSVSISQDDTEERDIQVVYFKLLKAYKKITKKMKRLEDDVELITKNLIFYFIKMQIEEDREISDDIILNYMTNEYQELFSADTESDTDIDWNGTYRFNYGDLIFDTIENQKCIVLRENELYAWLWYYNKIPNNELVVMKEKHTSSFISMKRCNIDEVSNNIN